MEGFAKNPNFVVITGFATDSRNNLWVLNWGSVNLKTLILFTNDSAYYFQNPPEGFQEVDQNYNLVIDQYGTKWYSSSDPNKSGLFYFNENNTINNLNDDYSGYLTTSDGLNTNSISSIVVDQMGDLWVGTSLGVNIISNTDAITTGSSSQLSISSVFSLRQYTINCIAVDPINQKWIGTNQGLILVNSDGSEVLASYNSINSPLQSDNITSIAIDKNLGIVYVGTDQGLTSFQTSAIKPNDSFTKLFIYPSPFVLKSGSNRVTIDGLIQNSEIKILTLRGKLVKDLLSPGGRVAYWDGTNTDGNLVSSGVYLVVAFDKDGTNVFTGKIAVIHH
jgi:ligand-binding sensor domain-containing protein